VAQWHDLREKLVFEKNEKQVSEVPRSFVNGYMSSLLRRIG
jgi:hypothetical protein